MNEAGCQEYEIGGDAEEDTNIPVIAGHHNGAPGDKDQRQQVGQFGGVTMPPVSQGEDRHQDDRIKINEEDEVMQGAEIAPVDPPKGDGFQDSQPEKLSCIVENVINKRIYGVAIFRHLQAGGMKQRRCPANNMLFTERQHKIILSPTTHCPVQKKEEGQG